MSTPGNIILVNEIIVVRIIFLAMLIMQNLYVFPIFCKSKNIVDSSDLPITYFHSLLSVSILNCDLDEKAVLINFQQWNT